MKIQWYSILNALKVQHLKSQNLPKIMNYKVCRLDSGLFWMENDRTGLAQVWNIVGAVDKLEINFNKIYELSEKYQ